MSYNVRFIQPATNGCQKKRCAKEINIAQENPEILCIQEFSQLTRLTFSQYKYNYINVEREKNKYGPSYFFSKLK
jgi:endonuclease/exonuclease/phosphatase family metal-dependent hydrolase